MSFEIYEQIELSKKNTIVFDWKKKEIKKNILLEDVINKLKSELKTFKVKAEGVEKKYHFNGNNYEITFV